MKETKFKQTEVGMIPCDWETKKLSEIASFRRGTFPQPYGLPQWYGGTGSYPFVQVADLSDNCFLLNSSTNQTISKMAQEKSLFVPKGSVIVTLQGTIGRVAITQYDCYMDRTLAVFESFKRNVCKEYFARALYEKFQSEAKFAPGGTIKTITKEVFSDFSIILPPVNEQRQIAQALSDIDSVISTTEKLIAKEKALKQGAMQTLLSGKMRIQNGKWTKTTNFKQTELGPIPQEWEVKSLGDFCTIKDGTHSTYKRVKNGCLLLSAKNVLDNKLEITNDESFVSLSDYNQIVATGFPKKGDILVSCVGSIGRCCIFDSDEKIAFQRSVAFIRNKLINNRLLMYSLQGELSQKQLEESKNASTLGGVYLSALMGIKVFIPPTDTEQTAIATVLSDMDSEIAALETKLAKYRQLKTGMMQQLLTGKVRLI